MNKNNFKKVLNSEIANLSLNRQIELLEKIKDVWIPEMIQARKKKEGTWVEPDKKDQYFFCKSCQRYTLKTKCKTVFEKEVRTQSTYRDAGYGDGDLEGDVEYLVEYGVCPKCGHKQEIKSHYVRTICEWLARYGRQKGRIDR